MIDFFCVFKMANEVYGKLQQDFPQMDLRVVDWGSAQGFSIETKVTTEPTAREKALAADTPYKTFGQLPLEVKGAAVDIDRILRGHIESIQKIPVELYRQFAEKLEGLFFGGPPSLIQRMAEYLGRVISGYFKEETGETEIDFRIRVCYPAAVIATCVAKNVALKYCFCDQRLVLSGFAEKSLVDSGGYESLGLDVNEFSIKELVVAESVPSLALLLERTDIYQQTADDILDCIIQKLIIADALDALQDVLISEDGGLVLYFDPILAQDEMETIIILLRESYPQVSLAATPDTDDSQWWVVEIRRLGDTAVQIATAGREDGQIPPPCGVIAKFGGATMTSIAKEIDVDAAVNAAGGG